MSLELSRMEQAVLNRDTGYNVSDKYNVINTMDVVQQFERYGFELSSVDAAGIRNQNKNGAQKHMVRMAAEFSMPGGLRPEVVIHNSYDGTKALNIRVGIFRVVCSNGLIAGHNLVPSLQVLHSNKGWADSINEFIDTYEEKHNLQKEWIEQMEDRKMGLDEAYHIAKRSLEIRHYDKRIENNAVDPLELLVCRRTEDRGDNAWLRYNVLQENLIQGNYRKYDDQGVLKKAKIMTNVDEIVRFNVELNDLFSEVVA